MPHAAALGASTFKSAAIASASPRVASCNPIACFGASGPTSSSVRASRSASSLSPAARASFRRCSSTLAALPAFSSAARAASRLVFSSHASAARDHASCCDASDSGSVAARKCAMRSRASASPSLSPVDSANASSWRSAAPLNPWWGASLAACESASKAASFSSSRAHAFANASSMTVRHSESWHKRARPMSARTPASPSCVCLASRSARAHAPASFGFACSARSTKRFAVSGSPLRWLESAARSSTSARSS